MNDDTLSPARAGTDAELSGHGRARPRTGPARLLLQRLRQHLGTPLRLAPDDLLRNPVYRRLWISILTSGFGGQVTLLALPLTAALLLHASPTQMGLLTAMEIAPFVLLSLPAGVMLDRVRKLPVYIGGELLMAAAVASVPLAWWAGWLGMGWMYAVAFVLGCVYTVAGSAAQVVLTQVVERERLVEAHAKNALANSGAEVAGPGLAGVLIRAVGAPLALLVDAALLLGSAAILRGVTVREPLAEPARRHFGEELMVGLRFVASQRLLVTLALAVGGFQFCHQCAMVVQILLATRELGLSEQAVGLSYAVMGLGSLVASLWGDRLSRRIGPGRALLTGFALCALGWAQAALAPAGPLGVAMYVAMLVAFALGATFIFINFLSLRQAVTPQPLLGRMTSTMRWAILIPAGPGALLGGWLGEHVGLRASLGCAGLGMAVVCALLWRFSRLPAVRQLPAVAAAA